MKPSNDGTPSDLHLPRDFSAALFDLAPVGYLALSEQGTIAVINSVGAELLGGSQATLPGSNFAGFVAAGDADRWQLHLVSVLERAEKQTCELMLARRDGASCAVRVDSKRSIQDGQASAVHLALTDISKLKHAEDLTSRRRAEEQTHFQAKLLSAIGQAVIATDLEGQITYMNAAAENIYGWPATAAVGRNVREVTVPEVSRSQGEEIMGQLTAGRSWSGEFAVRHRDGRVFVAEVHDTPILDSSGALVGIIGVSSDLSSRKQTEQSLAQSEARFATENRKTQETTQAASKYARSLLEASLDPLVTISADGKITDVNEASVQATGVPREVLIGTEFSDYFTDPDGARAGYLKTFSEGFVRDYPLAVRHTSGQIIDVLYNASVYKDDSGRVLGVFAAARDVTSQKQASRYARSLLEASLDPLVTIAADGKIPDVNEASVEATGVPRELLIGTDFCDYFTNPEEARAGYRRVFSEGLVRDYPLAVRHTNGRITDVLYNASVYKDEQGNVLGVFAAARDVTLQKQTSRYVRSLLEASLDPLVTISPDGKITDVNEASVEATGVPRERLVGTDFSEYFTSPDQARAGYRRVFSDGGADQRNSRSRPHRIGQGHPVRRGCLPG
ncbi:MAG: PAS domain S-box protein [Myxococcales bacterium]|nr:PAS domain S-box protein [Myxococcales bacterium]